MLDGSTRPIEPVVGGNPVLARGEARGKVEAHRVKQVFEREGDGTVELTFANGERMEPTEGHPFFVEGKGSTAAGQLRIGTLIVTRAGPVAKLAKVEQRAESKKVYN